MVRSPQSAETEARRGGKVTAHVMVRVDIPGTPQTEAFSQEVDPADSASVADVAYWLGNLFGFKLAQAVEEGKSSFTICLWGIRRPENLGGVS